MRVKLFDRTMASGPMIGSCSDYSPREALVARAVAHAGVVEAETQSLEAHMPPIVIVSTYYRIESAGSSCARGWVSASEPDEHIYPVTFDRAALLLLQSSETHLKARYRPGRGPAQEHGKP